MKASLYSSSAVQIIKALAYRLGMLFALLSASFQVSGQAIHHILMDGQSLSQGFDGQLNKLDLVAGPLSTTQPFNPPNLMLGDGCNFNLISGICQYKSVGFRPLIESVDPSNFTLPSQVPSGVETLASGMGNTLRALAPGYLNLVSHHGGGGRTYAQLSRVPSSPARPITGSPYYQSIVDAISTAKANAAAASRPYTVDALVITHGEQDLQTTHLSAAVYEANLLQWQADVSFDRNKLNGQSGTIPMFIDQMESWGPIGIATPTTDGTQNPASDSTPLGQWWAARDHPESIFLTAPKYGFMDYVGDNIHMANTGYRLLGGYHGKALKKVLVDGGRWVPLAPRSISIDANVITLRLWVPAGKITIDTTTLVEFTGCSFVEIPENFPDPTACRAAGGVWKVKGLEFYDSTNSAYITSVALASDDTLTVTLNTTPTGSNQRLRSAYSSRLKSATFRHYWSTGTNIRDTDTTVDYSGSHLYDWLITFDEPLGFAWDPYAGMPRPRRQLALGKPATQSSTLPGYSTANAAAAVDGNTNGDFFSGSVTHTNFEANAWWQVDLGASATIDSIVVWNRTDCCSTRLSDYWVFASDTPIAPNDTPASLRTRADTFSSHQLVAPDPSTAICTSGANGRYVRVQLNDTNNLSLSEVQVFGSGGLFNLAPGRSVAQSSTLPDYSTAGPESAIDGITDGNFFNGSVTHTTFENNPWWEVDLGTSFSVNSIAIWNRTDCCDSRLSDYWVFISDTPFGATDTPATLQGRAGTFSSHQTGAPNPSVTIATATQGRYARIQLSGAGALSLAEVQIFGQ